MTTDENIRDEKEQYEINRESAKISTLSSGKIDKYEYLTGKEILPSDQNRAIQQAKFTYSFLEKALEKQTKRIEDQEWKQIDTIMNQRKRKVGLIITKKYIKNLFKKDLMK